MKKTKKIIFSVAIVLSLIIIYTLISFSVIPEKSVFELTYSDFKKEICLGEELEITAAIRNKNLLIHKIICGSEILYIFMKKTDDETPSAFTSEANSDLFFMLEKKERTVKLKPEEKGDYKVFIVSKFSIREKQYNYESVIDVKVV